MKFMERKGSSGWAGLHSSAATEEARSQTELAAAFLLGCLEVKDGVCCYITGHGISFRPSSSIVLPICFKLDLELLNERVGSSTSPSYQFRL